MQLLSIPFNHLVVWVVIFNNNKNKKKKGNIIRHILTFVGGIAIANGLVDAAIIETVIGSVATLTGAIWSIVAKNKAV